MRIEQSTWSARGGWRAESSQSLNGSCNLVLAFGARAALAEPAALRDLQKAYPNARLVGCSTSGEICDTRVQDDSIVATAVSFDHTRIVQASVELAACRDSADAGRKLAESLDPTGLVHVFVLSDGLRVNGSELVEGLVAHLPPTAAVTGGLSGDGALFQQTLVCSDGTTGSGRIVAIGLYGDRLRVGYGSLGGWDPFGPERVITRSNGNVLYELDHQNALELYKNYLGDAAKELPASGLLFPLSIRGAEGDAVVRTILSVDEKGQSLTFAGDMPEGSYARLMHANFDRLIDGSGRAAQTSLEAVGGSQPDLALLISCVGRKLVLKQRIEEEVESVREVLGPKATLAGFYSYGEISPFTPSARCALHNQTMTITTLREV